MTVYVVQNALRKDPQTGGLVPKFDYSPAEVYGRIEFILPHAAKPFSPGLVLPEMRERLSRFSEDDYLLLTGNPTIMAMAFALAADMTDGNVKILQYDGVRHSYVPIVIENLFGDPDFPVRSEQV